MLLCNYSHVASLVQSFNHAQQMNWDSVKSDWEKEKQQILSVLTESTDEMLDISLPIAEVSHPIYPCYTLNKHKHFVFIMLQMTSGGMLPVSSKSVLDHQEMAYVKTVMDFNDKLLKGSIKPCLARKFAETAQAFNDQVVNPINLLSMCSITSNDLCQNVVDMWDMVCMMVDVPVKVTGDLLKSRGSPQMQRAFMNQARRYLEDRYSLLRNSVSVVIY